MRITRVKNGGMKALRLCALVCALVFAAALAGCMVPEDIKLRPGTTDEGDYWPTFVNPQPVSQGLLVLPQSCTGYTFKVMLTDLPPDDPLYQRFEVRWYLNYDEETNSRPIQNSWARELVQSKSFNLKEMDAGGGGPNYVLEVLVSDRGFDAYDLSPRDRKPLAKSHTALYTWVFTLSDTSVETCQ